MARKILIVEDEEALATMYSEKLQQAGYEVVLAKSSSEGIEKIKEEKPDIVLLDILLQDENGLIFLWKKQDTPKVKSIPVVAFSNYDDATMKKEALRLGAKDYLIKTDYTPAGIIEVLEKYLKK